MMMTKSMITAKCYSRVWVLTLICLINGCAGLSDTEPETNVASPISIGSSSEQALEFLREVVRASCQIERPQYDCSAELTAKEIQWHQINYATREVQSELRRAHRLGETYDLVSWDGIVGIRSERHLLAADMVVLELSPAALVSDSITEGLSLAIAFDAGYQASEVVAAVNVLRSENKSLELIPSPAQSDQQNSLEPNPPGIATDGDSIEQPRVEKPMVDKQSAAYQAILKDLATRLQALRGLYEQGLISSEVYQERQNLILDELP